MGKKYELRMLQRRGYTVYFAVMYNRLGGYYKEQVFMYYPKKEVIHKLRNEYDCVVSKEFV